MFGKWTKGFRTCDQQISYISVRGGSPKKALQVLTMSTFAVTSLIGIEVNVFSEHAYKILGKAPPSAVADRIFKIIFPRFCSCHPA